MQTAVETLVQREHRRRARVKVRTKAERDDLADQYLYHLLKLSGPVWAPENQTKIKEKRQELKARRAAQQWKRRVDQSLFFVQQQHKTLKQLINEYHDPKH